MAVTISRRYSIEKASLMDREARKLMKLYSATRFRIGIEVAKRLKEIEEHKLYLKYDPQAYPTFGRYTESLGLNYKTAKELIGLYEAFVLSAKIPPEQLSGITYNRLTTIKSMLFRKFAGSYHLDVPIEELNKWLDHARSDLSLEDLRQLVRDKRIGEHEHEWREVHQKICKQCRIKEQLGCKRYIKDEPEI